MNISQIVRSPRHAQTPDCSASAGRSGFGVGLILLPFILGARETPRATPAEGLGPQNSNRREVFLFSRAKNNSGARNSMPGGKKFHHGR